jgi:ABC-type phosphate transport system ATPase subunit
LGTGFFVHHRIVSADKRVDHHMKIMLEGEFNAKEEREKIFSNPQLGIRDYIMIVMIMMLE